MPFVLATFFLLFRFYLDLLIHEHFFHIYLLFKMSMGDTTAGDCGLSAPRIAEEEYSTAQGGV